MGSQVPGSSLNQKPSSYNNIARPQSINQVATTSSPTMDEQSQKINSISKSSVESAYPSPADEIQHSMAPPSPVVHRQPATSKHAGITLPSLREALQQHPLSPSTSPDLSAVPLVAFPGSHPTPTPMSRSVSGNSYTDNLRDPQLFPEHFSSALSTERHLPLFSPRSSGHTPTTRQLTTKITPRREKSIPEQSPLPNPSELPRGRLPGIWALTLRNPAQYYQDRRDEDEIYWPSLKSKDTVGTDMSRTASSQDGALKTVSGKRTLDRKDSANQLAPSKRQRVQRGEVQDVNRIGTRTSPRDAPGHDFYKDDTIPENIPKKPKSAPKVANTPVRKVKATPDVPDVNYNLYSDFSPSLSTLDDARVNFTANWSGRPLNNDDDPNRGLLHEKEVKLASKLALSPARYLYLKRRFFAGRLDFARRTQTFNINAAQQQCKGQDEYGVVGADVNKTSSLWKAFNSVGWLEPAHMEPYLD